MQNVAQPNHYGSEQRKTVHGKQILDVVEIKTVMISQFAKQKQCEYVHLISHVPVEQSERFQQIKEYVNSITSFAGYTVKVATFFLSKVV